MKMTDFYRTFRSSHAGKQSAFLNVFKGRSITKDTRGSANYIDTVISMFAIMLLIVLILNVFSFMTLKQNMDYAASQLAEVAAVDGDIASRVPARFSEICQDLGWDESKVSYTFEDSDFMENSSSKIQYGGIIRVKLSCTQGLNGTGIFVIPLNVCSDAEAVSGKYWKKQIEEN